MKHKNRNRYRQNIPSIPSASSDKADCENPKKFGNPRNAKSLKLKSKRRQRVFMTISYRDGGYATRVRIHKDKTRKQILALIKNSKNHKKSLAKRTLSNATLQSQHLESQPNLKASQDYLSDDCPEVENQSQANLKSSDYFSDDYPEIDTTEVETPETGGTSHELNAEDEENSMPADPSFNFVAVDDLLGNENKWKLKLSLKSKQLSSGLLTKYCDMAESIVGSKGLVGKINYVVNSVLLQRYNQEKADLGSDSFEVWLFHGTRCTNIKSICQNGFYLPSHPKYQKSNALSYGPGIYLGCHMDSSRYYMGCTCSKSSFHENSKDKSCKKMVVCRALISRCLNIPNGGFFPPVHPAPQYDAYCSPGNFYVLFEPTRILPVFVFNL